MRRGYSIFKRAGRGPFYVSWRDASGKRRIEAASDSRSTAHEIGRAKVTERDRIRGGVITAGQAKAKAAGIQPVQPHIDDWKQSLLSRQRTAKYAAMQAGRVKRLLGIIGVETLAQLTAEKVQSALGNVAELHTPNTANHYRTAMTMFCRWCVRNDRLIGSPMPAVDRISEAGDTFQRFAFTAEQLESLYKATETRKGKSPLRGIDRAMYYRLMANTGFRRSEAASLTAESFALDDPQQPHITVAAAYSKRRKRDTQPITHDFAEALRPWLASKTPGKRVFALPKWMGVERVFRADCKAAGIVAEKGVRLGAHSLRRFYITSIVRAAGLAVGQELARHSTPTLTKKYTDLDIADYRRGLAGLPQVKSGAKQQRRIG